MADTESRSFDHNTTFIASTPTRQKSVNILQVVRYVDYELVLQLVPIEDDYVAVMLGVFSFTPSKRKLW